MKIKHEFPPNIAKIKIAFPIQYGTLYAYGDTLYVPDGFEVDEALMRHEEVHMGQQGDDPEKWWDRYMFDVAFRASQEIQAYQVQYQCAKTIIKDRNKLYRYLRSLAMALSSPLYGSVMTMSEAERAIKTEKLYSFNTADVV